PLSAERADMKSLQSNKFKEIGEALIMSGLVTVDQQAEALGLSRSTAWTILRGKHKRSGLSASVIHQMLIAPQLPPLVRARLLEYIEEKIAGSYGHSPQQAARFTARLTAGRYRIPLDRDRETPTAGSHRAAKAKTRAR